MCYLQRCHTDAFDTLWPTCIKDAKFLIFQNGSVQLSSVDESGSQATHVCLAPTLRTFTIRFLAKVGQSLTVRASVSNGEVFSGSLTHLNRLLCICKTQTTVVIGTSKSGDRPKTGLSWLGHC